MSPPKSYSLNLADRFYLLLDGISAPAQIFLGAELDGKLDREALHRAARTLIRDYPKLDTRVVRGLLGYHRVPAGASGLEDLVILAQDESAFLQKRLDLRASRGIQWLYIERDGGGSTLLMAVHHSLCDGISALVAMERLSVLYGQFTGGETAIPAVAVGNKPDRYRDYLWKLAPQKRLWTIANAFLHMGRTVAGIDASESCATFTDMPLPCTGALRRRTIEIPTPDAHTLMRWAVPRHATVAASLLAAALVSGVSTWPQREPHPLRISLPVGRGQGAGLANRMLAVTLRIPLERCHSFSAAVEAVGEQMVSAWSPDAGIQETLSRAAPSFLPPPVFEYFARGYFARQTNTRETLTFSALNGPMDTSMSRFGDVSVRDIFTAGSLVAPPGLRLTVVAAPGKLNLCISYLHPVIGETSMDRFVHGIRSALSEVE